MPEKILEILVWVAHEPPNSINQSNIAVMTQFSRWKRRCLITIYVGACPISKDIEKYLWGDMSTLLYLIPQSIDICLLESVREEWTNRLKEAITSDYILLFTFKEGHCVIISLEVLTGLSHFPYHLFHPMVMSKGVCPIWFR